MARKILIVDDEKDIVEILQKKLLKEGYEVVTAFDGQEALVRMAENDPDVVLLDLMLPKLNGFEVLKEIRQKFINKWRPVIIISARTERDSIKQCYNLEADLYLNKPCAIKNILQGIETMISLIPLRINQE